MALNATDASTQRVCSMPGQELAVAVLRLQHGLAHLVPKDAIEVFLLQPCRVPMACATATVSLSANKAFTYMQANHKRHASKDNPAIPDDQCSVLFQTLQQLCNSNKKLMHPIAFSKRTLQQALQLLCSTDSPTHLYAPRSIYVLSRLHIRVDCHVNRWKCVTRADLLGRGAAAT